MPARLSPPPQVLPRASSSPEIMSLTETSRPASDSHLHHLSLSYMVDSRSTRNLHHGAFSGTWRAHEFPDSSLRHDPDHSPESDPYSRPDSTSSLSRMLAPSHPSPRPMYANSTSSERYQRTAGYERLESSPLLPTPTPERENPKEMSDSGMSSSTLKLPSDMHKRPLTALRGNPEVKLNRTLHGKVPRDDASGKMGISSLIDHEEPSPCLLYDLIVRQQPIAARACGYGDRDRRVVDPPPILQMVVRDPRATPAELYTKMRYPFSVIYCELWNAEQDHDEMAMPEVGDRPHGRRLMGTLVSSPFVGRDELGEEGCFFPFPDLSCRTTGKYRLRFALVVLNPANMRHGERLPFQATVLSNVFEVYPAKTFPGMVQSTELAKRLKDQGCLISVKKGHQRRELSLGLSRIMDQGEENNEDDADASETGREKRQKT